MCLVTEYGAKCDGTSDDTVQVQECVDSETLVEFPAGTTCRINASVGINYPSGRTIVMNGARIVILTGSTGKARAFSTEPLAKGIRFVGGELVGDLANMTGLEWRIGLRIDQSEDVIVEGMHFTDWRTDAIWVGGNTPSRLVRISDVCATKSSRNHVSLTNADGVTLERCILTACPVGANPGAGVDVEPNPNERVDNVTILDCETSDNEVGLYLQPGKGLPGNNYKVLGCNIYASRKYGLICNSVVKAALIDNHISGTPKGVSIGAATEPVRATGIRFLDNIVEETPQALILAGIKDSTISDNRFIGSGITWAALGAAGDMVYLGNVYE